jgi:aspartate racemase
MISMFPQGLEAMLESCSAVLGHPLIEQMGWHLEGLLAAGLADRGSRPKHKAISIERADNARSVASRNCAHELIERRVRRSPLATAVCFGGERLTYEALNGRANQLAYELRAHGVGPDVLVGLFCNRSADLAVAMLSVLKSGGAFLPIDARCPRERIAMILEDAEVSVLLTQEGLVDRLPETDAQVVCLDGECERGRIQCHPHTNPASISGPDDLAYVIYTSGTTGRPKGVAITHRSLVNHNMAMIERYGLRPGDRVLQFSAIDFDIAVEEIFPTWVCGACLVMRTDDFGLSGREFTDFCRDQGITVLNLATAFWQEWTDGLAAGQQELAETIRTVIVGGEAPSAEIYRAWLGVGGGRVKWFNSYGPTETTITATVYGPLVNVEPQAVPERIPIGRAIANTRVYVLNDQLEEVPTGVPGELYVAGAGLARGYLHRPELTEERFVPDPFQPGDRMYKTGDRCRRLADGNIEFLGRVDRQVKIRGFRVELGEIETVLERHPAVRHCVVSTFGRAGSSQLAAYLVVANGEEPTSLELRQFLAEKVPQFMLPARFVVLDKLPLTSNGKIDYKALPPPDGEIVSGSESHEPPRTASERQLVEIWEDLLGVRPIGVRDDFFDLGGDSLLAARMVTRLERTMGLAMPIASLLSSPTIAALAQRLDTQRCREKAGVLVPLRPEGTRAPVFLVAGVGGHVFVFRELAELLGKDQPVYGLQGIGLDGMEKPLCRMEDIAARYISEITAIQPEGPYFVGGWSMGAVMAYEIAVQLRAQGRSIGAVFIVDMPAPWKGSLGRRIRDHFEEFRRRPLPGKIAYLGQRVSRRISAVKLRLGIYPPVVGFDGPTAELIRECGLAQCQAERRYCPRPYAGDIVVLKAENNVEATDPRAESPYLGWDTLVRGRIQVCPVPGNHMGIFTGDNVRQLAATMRRFLGE